MAKRISTRLTAAEGRKFGLTVGLALVGVGLLLLWRGRITRAEVVLGVGGTLVIAALLVPTWLGPIERAGMGLAHLISKGTTPIFMGIVYFIVIAPIGLVRRLVGASPITRRGRVGAGGEPHAPPTDRPPSMENQV